MTAAEPQPQARVGIIMGCETDWPTMRRATEILDELGVAYKTQIISAHSTPGRLYQFAGGAAERGLQVIIAGAGGAAHLPGMVASMSLLPVIAVPMNNKSLNGLDSLLSIAQMPPGVAVATQAIGSGGAFNAGLLATQILSLSDSGLRQRLENWRQGRTDNIPEEVASCTSVS